MRIAILGNGGFGTAMALSLSRAGHAVGLWGHDAVYTAHIAASRRNPRYLDGVVLPDAVRISNDAAAVLDRCELVLVAVPTQHVRSAVRSVQTWLPPAVPVVSLAKGLEQSTGLRPSQVLAELLGDARRVFALSGPSHAEEIARELPTTVVIAGPDEAVLQHLQTALQTRVFRVYRNHDLLGIELCGALKNVMALAAGIADGLGYGDNAKAAILSRGLVEMQRYGLAHGADPRTFFGLAGVGDLAVTAFSRHGRNRAFGERIGRGETFEQVLAASPKVAEGVWTSRVVAAEAQRHGVEMPIARAVARVLFEGLSPQLAVRELMERDAKAEG
ncbi:MAG: NAD(P)-dependent glycerol-3-phosphate dehydrogenase [Planctomycetes bacterium]|jgi:glycerol-3-phosphate dehydrogenase (NAD(P)+)|nr:NAD(P)-dependent glycerol-3-phosphate dehydrogenase [Planctomycetota bacterium]